MGSPEVNNLQQAKAGILKLLTDLPEGSFLIYEDQTYTREFLIAAIDEENELGIKFIELWQAQYSTDIVQMNADMILLLRKAEFTAEMIKAFKIIKKDNPGKNITFGDVSMTPDEAIEEIQSGSELGETILKVYAKLFFKVSENLVKHLMPIEDKTSITLMCCCGEHNMSVGQLIDHIRAQDGTGLEFTFMWGRVMETLGEIRKQRNERVVVKLLDKARAVVAAIRSAVSRLKLTDIKQPKRLTDRIEHPEDSH